MYKLLWKDYGVYRIRKTVNTADVNCRVSVVYGVG